jgi:hypothetical protein
MKKKLTVVAAVVVLLLFFLFWDGGPDEAVGKVKEMQDALFGPSAQKLSPAERRERLDELKKAQRELTPEQRKELWAGSRERKKAELARYARMASAEKRQWLDERIKRSETVRKSASKDGGKGGPGRTGGAPAGDNAGGGAGPGGGKSFEDRERFRKQMLDATTPEERATMDMIRKDMAARRAQLGLPPQTRGFGGPR